MQSGTACLFGGVVLSLAVGLGAPASAADIVLNFGTSGVLTPIQLSKTNTYDFTFATSPSLPNNSTVTLSIFADTLVTNQDGQSQTQPEKLQYQLYWGDPESGMFLAQSLRTIDPAVSFNPIPGSLYVEISPSEIARDGETVSGSLTATSPTAVPEPAAWVMMSIGFGALGAFVRRRRTRSAVTA